jgi:hypothetical protein
MPTMYPVQLLLTSKADLDEEVTGIFLWYLLEVNSVTRFCCDIKDQVMYAAEAGN